MKQFLITTIALILSGTVNAQSTFFKTINHGGYMLTMKTLRDGNIVTGGFDVDGFVIKRDPQGQVIWQTNIQTPFIQILELEEAADSGIFVLFTVPYPPARSSCVMKLNTYGQMDWLYVYHTGSSDEIYDIQALPDSGFAMIGNGCSINGAQLVRCKKDGSIAWQKNYVDNQGKIFNFSRIMLADNETTFLLAGSTLGVSPETDLLVAKMDTAGNMLWFKEYPLPGTSDVANAICFTHSGFAMSLQYTVYLSATSYSRSGLTAFDSSGNMLWITRYYFPASSSIGPLVQLPDSTFITSGGMLYPADTTRTRALLMGTSSMGQQLWSHAFSDSIYSSFSVQNASAMVLHNSGDLFLQGGGYDMYFCRANTAGFGMCNPVYYGPQTVYLGVPAIVNRTTFVLPGAWTQSPFSVTITTEIALEEYTSCNNVITESAAIAPVESWTIHSDPFSDDWILSAPASLTTGKAGVQLQDALGRIVLQTTFSGGNGTYRLERNGLAAGVYFYSISEENGNLSTGKILAR